MNNGRALRQKFKEIVLDIQQTLDRSSERRSRGTADRDIRAATAWKEAPIFASVVFGTGPLTDL